MRLTLGDREVEAPQHSEQELRFIYEEIFEKRIYDHPEMRIRKQGAVVVDVGANVGLFALWATQRHRCRAIICYEPNRSASHYLKKNLAQLAKHIIVDASCYQVALGARVEQRMLSTAPGYSSVSSLLPDRCLTWRNEVPPTVMRRYKVPVTTMRDEMRRLDLSTIDLLKIDAEGLHAEVIDGLPPHASRSIGNIVLEADYLPESEVTILHLEAKLHEQGYCTYRSDASAQNNVILYATAHR